MSLPIAPFLLLWIPQVNSLTSFLTFHLRSSSVSCRGPHTLWIRCMWLPIQSTRCNPEWSSRRRNPSHSSTRCTAQNGGRSQAKSWRKKGPRTHSKQGSFYSAATSTGWAEVLLTPLRKTQHPSGFRASRSSWLGARVIFLRQGDRHNLTFDF